MTKHNQDGAVSGLAISLVLAMMLLVGAVAFGYWAFNGRQDYKNNVDAKVSVAVENAVQKEDTVKDAQFAQASKKPLTTYTGPESYGSLVLQYPKTWSGYVDSSGNGQALVDGYFAPGVVPSITDTNSVFALRMQVVDQSYADVLQTFAGQQMAGKLTVSAYALPLLPKIVGVEVVGQLQSQKTVSMVVLPLRANTLEIWTEGSQYVQDFNTNILPNFSFSP